MLYVFSEHSYDAPQHEVKTGAAWSLPTLRVLQKKQTTRQNTGEGSTGSFLRGALWRTTLTWTSDSRPPGAVTQPGLSLQQAGPQQALPFPSSDLAHAV